MSAPFTVRGICVEVPKVELNRKQVAGLTVLATKEVQELKVLYATEIPFCGSSVSVQPGDTILVTSELLQAQRWSKETYDYRGQQFVICPYDAVLGTVPVEDPVRSAPLTEDEQKLLAETGNE